MLWSSYLTRDTAMIRKALQSALFVVCVGFAPLLQAGVVNINKADAAALVENLKGIGPKKAAAIVAYRKAHGAFGSIDELLKVKGIGEKLLQQNRRDLSLNKGATRAQAKSKASGSGGGSAATSAVKPAKASSD